ncbi:MAG TPA: deoxyribose-phosphate aldolase [Terriglobales bacterium]|jgi:deoxyribose-phosphate aldolase|nr:deoxyribose-phosphate aldolase [Terriglobales bacterium]
MPIEISEAPQIAVAPAQADWQRLAAILDHTLLKPESTNAEVERLCREALDYGFACVMLNPTYIALASSFLAGTGVKIGCVVGFPFGANTTNVKRYEALDAIRLGAHEVDMVMNIGALKSGDRVRVQADMQGMVQIAHDNGAILKITIETALLSLEEKILACQLAVAAGADFVKSSTGFSHAGAVPADISLMRGVVGEKLGVKASGGIRTFEDAQTMVEAGANRIGTSSSVSIVESARTKSV